jgi:hypothetical protein
MPPLQAEEHRLPRHQLTSPHCPLFFYLSILFILIKIVDEIEISCVGIWPIPSRYLALGTPTTFPDPSKLHTPPTGTAHTKASQSSSTLPSKE